MKVIRSRQFRLFRLFGYCSCSMFHMLSSPGHVLAVSSITQIQMVCRISQKKSIKHLEADRSCENDTEHWIGLRLNLIGLD